MNQADRWCPTGNHFRKRVYFNVGTNGKIARDCADCESARKLGRKTAVGGRIIRQELDGVDIDAIHFKLGAIRPGYMK